MMNNNNKNVAASPEKPRSYADDELHGLETSSYYSSNTSFYLTLLSNSLFFAASLLYLYLSTNNWRYENRVLDFPEAVLDADDDGAWSYWGFEDDYIFETPWKNDEDVWVSLYQMVYFAAASGFVLSGIVDLLHWRTWYSALMIIAAGFGVAAAVVLESDLELSNTFNMVSVHIWMAEAFTVFINRTEFGNMKTWLRLADTTFVVGTIMDVVLSWVYRGTHPFRAGLLLAALEITAACFWMITATIYLVCTLALKVSKTSPSAAATLSYDEQPRRQPAEILFPVNVQAEEVGIEAAVDLWDNSDIESEGYA